MDNTQFSRRGFMNTAAGSGLALTAFGGTALGQTAGGLATSTSTSLHVRQNIASLTADQLKTLKHGVQVMKSKPVTDPRSWQFQANIHGMNGHKTNPLFKQCQHGTIFFFAWHRGYLYFFERILREASGDPKFTLPYWDWTNSPALPAPYRQPANVATNPLYDNTRDINDGSLLPPGVVVDDLNAAVGQIDYFLPASNQNEDNGGFSGSLEGSPHGQVHVLVGGRMSQVPTSANDPIFWLHHCNIDRQWNRWLNMGDGRLDPSDSSYLNTKYSYADETGQTVTMKVSDILSSAKLGYRYDNVPNPAPATSGAPHVFAAAGPPVPAGNHAAGAASGTLVATSGHVGPVLADAPVQAAKPLEFKSETVKLNAAPQAAPTLHAAVMAAHAAKPGKLILEVQGLSVAEPPKFTYEVFLNLPDGDVSSDQLRQHRVGSINFFGKGSDAAEHGHGVTGTFAQSLDATATVARLRELGHWDPANLSVTLRPVTVLAPKGKEAEAKKRAEDSAGPAKISYKQVVLRVAP
jgi:Common central domain of tyrosinase/Polyphenol oxidase middle domain